MFYRICCIHTRTSVPLLRSLWSAPLKPISGKGLKDGFESLRVAYTATDGTTVDKTLNSELFESHSDKQIIAPADIWNGLASPKDDVVFTLIISKGSGSFTARVAERE